MRRSGLWFAALPHPTATHFHRPSFKSAHLPTHRHPIRSQHPPATPIRHLSSAPAPAPAPSPAEPPLPPPLSPLSLPPSPSASTSPSSSSAIRTPRLSLVFNSRPSSPAGHNWHRPNASHSPGDEKERANDSQSLCTHSAALRASVGEVRFVREDIVHVEGLSSAAAGALVRFSRTGHQSSTPSYGLVMAVQPHRVIVACLTEGSSQPSPPSTGSLVHHVRGEVPSFPVGPSILGRTLTPLGHPADDLAPLPLPSSSTSPVPSPSSSSPSSSSSPTLHYLPTLNPLTPSLTHRSSPTHFLSTGFKHLDFFHPLTRGLRIGLLGDKLTGKTTLALDSLIWVIRQSKGGVKGVYVCVGKKRAEVRRVRERLLHAGVLDEVTIVHSSDGDSQASQYLAPFSGCTVADWWRDQGKHCVIVYDDLVTHGAICNGMERSIGYPSLSTSYIHAKLLERTAAITGGGSSTAICILESPRPDRAVSVIESLVGFVDHCVYLDSSIAADGLWPAINCSSIIGRPSARFRSPLTRSITNLMSQSMLQSERTANQYAWAKEFGLEEEEEEDVEILTYRDKLQLLLSQRQPMPLHDQFLTLIAATRRNLAAVSHDELEAFEAALQATVRADAPQLYARLREVCESEEVQHDFSGSLRQQLQEAVSRFMQTWKRQRGYEHEAHEESEQQS